MINTDFPITITSIDEFLRILIPDKRDAVVDISTIRDDSVIELSFSSEGKTINFSYKNISDRLDDQKVVMAKVGLLILFEKNYKWGALTGVRPTKLIRKFLENRITFEEMDDILENLYLISPEKTKLMLNITKTELEYLNNDFINIYIGIPYCPSKCNYCSFASYELNGTYGKYFSLFLDKLIKEIDIVSELMKKCNKPIESIYIGGGTPTTLNEIELKRLLEKVNNSFDLSHLKEFTLEAGRPETINREKLQIAKQFGVNRISVNPQTFNDVTLKNLNRLHTIEEFDRSYTIAKEFEFVLNMDLIIGLAGETTDDIIRSISKVRDYDIENLTIHCLALKRSSELYKNNYIHEELNYQRIEEELKRVTSEKLLIPYYMYRQKNSLDWGENVGFSKKGCESIFNMNMIEEFQNTIGIGGGAITKIITPNEIVRIVNPKDPIMYINEFENRIKEKIEFLERNL